MYEMLLGMNIINDDKYTEYRTAMTPILTACGGSFGYDFKVSEVLISATPEPINRVFTIRFPSLEVKDAFFSNADYLQIKEDYFNVSVMDITLISAYEK